MRETSEGQWEADVLQAERPVLVDFWAAWCAPCQMMEPILARLEAEYAGRLDVVKVDVQANPEIALRYDVINLPTLALFRGGELMETLPGYMPYSALESKLKGYL